MPTLISPVSSLSEMSMLFASKRSGWLPTDARSTTAMRMHARPRSTRVNSTVALMPPSVFEPQATNNNAANGSVESLTTSAYSFTKTVP